MMAEGIDTFILLSRMDTVYGWLAKMDGCKWSGRRLEGDATGTLVRKSSVETGE
jgi:hypothetical protein